MHATGPGGTGFWWGVTAGVMLSLGLALLAAVLIPPVRHLPPVVPADLGQSPEAPWVPGAGRLVPAPDAAPPRPGGLLTLAPAPLLNQRPAAEMPAGLPALSAPPAPDVFKGDASGSPSLVPLGAP